MHKPIIASLALAAMLFAAGCASLEPAVPTAEPAILSEWPLPPRTGTAIAPAPTEATSAISASTAAADIGWRDFFADPRLQELIARSLDNNRDMRVAVLNVERARAQYRVQRADRLPSVGVNGAMTRSDPSPLNGRYSVELGIADFELDLFGRVRSLSNAALQRYFAQEEARRSAQLSLIAEVANVYLTLAADRELLKIAQQTLKTHEESYALTEKRHALGAVSALDLHQARTLIETARADTARFAGLIAQDINALNLLVGAPVEPALLPDGVDAQVTGLAALPAGLPSEVLLRRPDVLQSEYQLRAANADIGAARAAFFPSITLTGGIGTASNELSGLFDGGTSTWRFMPQINLPIFQGGRLRGNLDVAKADRDIALAQYEKAIQTGFREVADALALTRTLAEERQAQRALVDAATNADQLSGERYRAGYDSYLVRLDAQRTLYAAQQGLVSTGLAEQANRVTLYKVLGGGWKERNQ
jgi:multidrug efflux system outer membrane protein